MRGPSLALAVALIALLTAACGSPESTRMRGGGPGGDVGNRSPVVELHEGARPYHGTPRLVEHGVEAAQRVSRRVP